MERLTSRKSALIRHLRRLASDGEYRREAGEVRCEGSKTLRDAIDAGARIASVLWKDEPQRIDVEFMERMAMNGVPFVIAFTKADKIGKTIVQRNIANYFKQMRQTWEELPQYFVTSAMEKTGSEEILNFVEDTNKLFVPPVKQQPNKKFNIKNIIE